MRKWHRRLAVVFGIFLFWIAMTGLGTHIVQLQMESEAGHGPSVVPEAQAHGGEEHEAPPPIDPQAAGAPQDFACPAGWSCRPIPPKDELAEAADFVRHLHSGEGFGPIGTAISIASGLALLFFALSGLWMYVSMWRGRKGKGLFW